VYGIVVGDCISVGELILVHVYSARECISVSSFYLDCDNTSIAICFLWQKLKHERDPTFWSFKKLLYIKYGVL
jgi:hypothetical protein